MSNKATPMPAEELVTRLHEFTAYAMPTLQWSGDGKVPLNTVLVQAADMIDNLQAIVDKLAEAERERDAAFRKGAEFAASCADHYNSSTLHPYRLGDCILHKLNLRRQKPRRNDTTAAAQAEALRGALEDVDGDGTVADCLRELHRLITSGADMTKEGAWIRWLTAQAEAMEAALASAQPAPTTGANP